MLPMQGLCMFRDVLYKVYSYILFFNLNLKCYLAHLKHPYVMYCLSDSIRAQVGSRTSTVQAMVYALMVCAHVMLPTWVRHVMFLCVQTIAAMTMESATMNCTAVTVKKGTEVSSFFYFHHILYHVSSDARVHLFLHKRR
jgi:hypothetical protein